MSTFQYSRFGSEFESAAPRKPLTRYDFVDFLGAAQTLKIDFLPITWQPALDPIGGGATAEIREASMNSQISFAFKRPKLRFSFNEEFETHIIPFLIAEISVLSHPEIRKSPNIVRLEGICWEVVSEGHNSSREDHFGNVGGGVVPVLVFEKSKYGDLRNFVAQNEGSTLVFEDKLQLCFDIARAVEEMHSNQIIHGDIKPENVLVFANSIRGYTAKVLDFGYSTQYMDINELIILPKSKLWHAPEWHHRGFSPLEGKKMDAYSFGMLVLWFLCYGSREDLDWRFKDDLASESYDALALAHEIVPKIFPSHMTELLQFFNETLTANTADRCSNFYRLGRILAPERNEYECFAKHIGAGHSPQFEKFQVLQSMNQLYQADYRVRLCIAHNQLRKLSIARRDQKDPYTFRDLGLQCAFCYEIGFGVRRDQSKSQALLEEFGISKEHFYGELDSFRYKKGDPDFYAGNYDKLRDKGYLGPIDLAEGYRGEVKIDKIRREYQLEIADAGEALGFDHHVVFILKHQLASALSRHGLLAEAEELQLQVMVWCEEAFGLENADTFSSMGNLAVTYLKQHRYDEAKKLQVQLADTSARLLGGEHSYTLANKVNLSTTLKSRGRWEEAEELDLQLVKSMTKVLGEDHASTINSMGNLANTYMHQERWDEAEKMQSNVVEKLTRVLGADHPDTLMSIANLAAIYWSQGQKEKGEKLLVNILDTRKRLLGEEHPNTIDSMDNLSYVYTKEKRWKDARILQEQIMQLKKRKLGVENSDTLAAMCDLALTYEAQSEWKAAEELYVEMIEVKKRTRGPEHPDTLTCMADLAETYWNQSRHLEAIELMHRVVAHMKKALGANDPDTEDAISLLYKWCGVMARSRTDSSNKI